ncbi:Isy1-like splicing factor [Piedraia hortae CBS 480.64]|uniref:Isy1-like splicing factor n=1 Tax=Piedraia hortae CBS 480.64 TaxID=1314780 RepID=A0A6A7C494_9PEZI|nr:Isy1-like splicing factor [Piedraia hortae CBS 480.64]
MARNAEKAQSMLFRFRAQQASDLGILDVNKTRRPRAVTTIDSVPVCERWRGQIVKEISRKLNKIQDVSLSDYQIRDLNDELNKLFKEKWQWEARIRELGGPNYMRSHIDGVESGGKGYRYFGRAKELPGVKELFEAVARAPIEAEEERQERRRAGELRQEIRNRVDAGYYGCIDEEDDALLAAEAAKEKEAFSVMMDEPETSGPEWEPLPGDIGDGKAWKLPTAADVEAELLERRKKRLLDRL